MFNQLPKLLGRGFIVGFFLPASLFALANFLLLESLDFLPDHSFVGLAGEKPWLATTGATLTIGLLACVLLLLNRSLVRLKEGYGILEHRRSPLLWYQQWRWNRLQRDLDSVENDLELVEIAGEAPSRDLTRRRISLHRRFVQEFPDSDMWLLPTAFGNVTRALEVYPRVMYGFGAIRGWTRLLAIIPKDYREQIEDARAQMDFWVNIWALSFLFATECAILQLASEPHGGLVSTFSALITSWWSSRRARFAAIEWGEFVKSAFDVFLPDLSRKLELEGAVEKEGVKAWFSFSQAIAYRTPGMLPVRKSQAHVPRPESGMDQSPLPAVKDQTEAAFQSDPSAKKDTGPSPDPRN